MGAKVRGAMMLHKPLEGQRTCGKCGHEYLWHYYLRVQFYEEPNSEQKLYDGKDGSAQRKRIWIFRSTIQRGQKPRYIRFELWKARSCYQYLWKAILLGIQCTR